MEQNAGRHRDAAERERPDRLSIRQGAVQTHDSLSSARPLLGAGSGEKRREATGNSLFNGPGMDFSWQWPESVARALQGRYEPTFIAEVGGLHITAKAFFPSPPVGEGGRSEATEG